MYTMCTYLSLYPIKNVTTKIMSLHSKKILRIYTGAIIGALLLGNSASAATTYSGKQLVSQSTHTSDSADFAADRPVERLWDGCTVSTPNCVAASPDRPSFFVEFDLGSLHTLEAARLFADADGTSFSQTWSFEYKAEASDQWTSAFKDSDAYANGWIERPFTNITARYVRVTVGANRAQAAAPEARELEIYGTPVPPPMPPILPSIDPIQTSASTSQTIATSSEIIAPALPLPIPIPIVTLPLPITPAPIIVGTFQANMQVTVMQPYSIRLRADHTTNAVILARKNPGAIALVLEGPVATDGYAWYKVKFTSDNSIGWAAGEFLTSTTSSGRKYEKGATVTTIANVSVRDNPAGAKVGQQVSGSRGIIVDAIPAYRAFMGVSWWWKIDYTTGPDGWSAQNYIK